MKVLIFSVIAALSISTASANGYPMPQDWAEVSAQEWANQNGIEGVMVGCRPYSVALPGKSCQVIGTGGDEIRNGYRHVYTLYCSATADQSDACSVISEEWRPM